MTPTPAPTGNESGIRADAAGRTLARCRALVTPGLDEAVARLHPYLADMACYALGRPRPGEPPEPGPEGGPGSGGEAGGSGGAPGGKGVRQALAVLGAEAAGAPGTAALPGAVAVELIHVFSLLHDDIMDGDELRRGRATAWKAYGTGPAVLAGDALFALAMETLTETGGPHGAAAVALLSRTLGTLVRGQAEDLAFENRPWSGAWAVGPGEYRTMAGHKTGALLGCALAIGARLAGAPQHTVDTLEQAGQHMGIAFQAVDDLLGTWGDPAATGKPVHSDLRHRKKTLPVLAALRSRGPEGRELSALLSADAPWTAESLAHAADLVERAGGRAAALTAVRREMGSARSLLDSLPLAPQAAADLAGLLPYLAGRTV